MGSHLEKRRRNMKTLINWKVYLILLVATVLATLAVLPYSLELQSMGSGQPAAPPTLATLGPQIIQAALIDAVLIFLGMILMKRIGLGAPILDAVTKGEPTSGTLRRVLPLSVALGVAATLLIFGLSLAFQPLLTRDIGAKADALRLTGPQPAAWKGFLASFSGGIGEEIQLRLFAMSLLAWLGSFISRTLEGRPTSAVFWIANILAAVLFGVGHLPTVALAVPLTAMVILRTVVLNAVGGVTFGWLYQTRGLESAMVAHFSADIVLHVLLAL
jgi:hypothetical protein